MIFHIVLRFYCKNWMVFDKMSMRGFSFNIASNYLTTRSSLRERE